MCSNEGRRSRLPSVRDSAHSGLFGDAETTDRPPCTVGFYAEHRAHQERHRPRRPRLRAAGSRHLNRLADLAPRVSREDLGQPVTEARSGFEDGGGYPVHLVQQAVAPQAAGDQGVVVGPDRAVVVGVRVVAPFTLGHGPHTPAAEELLAHQPVGYGPRPTFGYDAAPEEVSGAGAQRVDPAPGSVEGEGVVAAILHPEVPVETLPEIPGLRPEPPCQARVSPNLVRDSGGPQERVVDVTLDLAGRYWRFGAGPVAEEHGVRAISPTVVPEARRRTGGVSHIAPGTGGEDPIQGAPRGTFELPDELHVAAPAPGLIEEDQKERGGVRGAVVRGVRDLSEEGELSVTDLVRYLAGLGVAEVVTFERLMPGQRPQSVLRRFGAQDHGLV